MKKISLLILISIFLSGCEIVKQFSEIKALTECKYNITGCSNVLIANYDIQKTMRNREVNTQQLSGLTMGFISRNIPLQATINLNIYNPSEQNASINKLEYKLFLDDTEFFSGYINQNILVKPKQNTDAKIDIQGNIYNLLKNINTIAVFLNKNKNAPNSNQKIVTITLKLKPSLIIAGQLTQYPNYIVISKEITNQNFSNL